VAVTPASGFVYPWGGLAIGLIAGLVCYGSVCLKPKLGYDDSLDAFGVHGVGGLVGSLLTGVFAASALGGSEAVSVSRQLEVQAIACAATAAWSGAVTWLCIKVADLAFSVRVDEEHETIGLDLTAHEERGYDF
jgi:Amt family ammonium transporter